MIGKDDFPIKNQCLKTFYEYCTLMQTEEEQTSFHRGYNYAFKLMKSRIKNMDKYADKKVLDSLKEIKM